jgi:hypothetical protein
MFSWMVLCIVGLILSSLLFISAIALTTFIEFYSEIIWTLFAEPINIGKAEPKVQDCIHLVEGFNPLTPNDL